MNLYHISPLAPFDTSKVGGVLVERTVAEAAKRVLQPAEFSLSKICFHIPTKRMVASASSMFLSFTALGILDTSAKALENICTRFLLHCHAHALWCSHWSRNFLYKYCINLFRVSDSSTWEFAWICARSPTRFVERKVSRNSDEFRRKCHAHMVYRYSGVCSILLLSNHSSWPETFFFAGQTSSWRKLG